MFIHSGNAALPTTGNVSSPRVDGAEDPVMSTLFDLLIGVQEDEGEDLGL